MEKEEFNFLLWKDNLNNEIHNFWIEIFDK